MKLAALVLSGALILSAETATLPEVKTQAGRQFYSLPDDKGLVAAARKNLEADPNNTGLLLKLAAAQSAVWQYREAVATCSHILKLAPDNAAALLERGHRELALREFKQSRADLQRARQLDAKNPEVYYHLGLAHYFLGEFAQSAEAFSHAVEFAPNTDSRINSTNWYYAS